MRCEQINYNITIRPSFIKLGLFLIIAGVLYVISLENYLLFRIVVNQFNVIIAYMVFIIVWKSKVVSENRYLTFIGTALFFIACLGFLRSFSYEEINVFSGFGANLPAQLWIAMRYLGGVSFFVAPLLLTGVAKNEKMDSKPTGNDQFGWEVFFVFLLYRKRDRFEKKVFRILMAAITVSIFAELSLTNYTYTEEVFNFIGHTFNVLSFYLIYMAIVETGFEEPCNLLFRELKFREEALRRETTFLKDDQGRIYRMLGVEKCTAAGELPVVDMQAKTEQYSSFVRNIQGLIGFRLDEKGTPVFMDGAVEEITAYSKKAFMSGKGKWAEIVEPEDRPLFLENLKNAESNPDSALELEYRIRRKDGEIRWVREIMQLLPKNSGIPGKFQGFVHDITQRKMAEKTLSRTDEARIKEIHHRIKNNLQVISSLLSLQAEKFSDKETLEAFRESQNRVASMALIHEELYQGKDMETLDFAAYLRELTSELLSSYTVGNERVSLKLDIEQLYLGMDTAVPLGIIVNELVSNSLKHAFPAGKAGEIRIRLFGPENYEIEGEKDLQFTLSVADDGKGFPEKIDFKNTDSLGLQLVKILVEQIEGCIELKRDPGTEFKIEFKREGN